MRSQALATSLKDAPFLIQAVQCPFFLLSSPEAHGSSSDKPAMQGCRRRLAWQALEVSPAHAASALLVVAKFNCTLWLFTAVCDASRGWVAASFSNV